MWFYCHFCTKKQKTFRSIISFLSILRSKNKKKCLNHNDLFIQKLCMNLNHLNTHIKELYTIIWILRNFKNLLSKANNSISLLAILKNVDRCHFTIFLICVKQTISQTGVCKSKNIKLHSCPVGISIPNYYFIHLFKDLSKKIRNAQ